MRRRSFVLSLAAIISLLVSVFSFSVARPPAAHAAGITIDGTHEAAWGSPLASRTAGGISEPNLDLTSLYVTDDNSNVYIAWDAYATNWEMKYGIAIDTGNGPGATSQPWGLNINTIDAHRPQYYLMAYHPSGGPLGDVQLTHWDGSNWSYPTVTSLGGAQGYSQANHWVELRIPKSALGNPSHLWLELFSAGSHGHAQVTVPTDPNVAYSDPNWDTTITTTLSNFVQFNTTHVPAHDNNVEYDGLGFNSQDSLYRVPFGAVTPGTPVTLRFRTYHNDVTGVKVRLYDTATASESFQNMSIAASNVSCYDAAQPAAHCDFWQTTVTPSQPSTIYYRFIISDGTATAYYADTNLYLGGYGTATPNPVDNSYAITVYAPTFQPISWMRNAVIYQIFPDRFYNGQASNDPVATPQNGIIKKSWNSLPEGYCTHYDTTATPCTEGPHGRDYFGGDIVGILQKLPYLKSLGVNVIYLNPIFQSNSNHGYDTVNYLQISPYFGTTDQFVQLARAAHNQGMKIVLDGVFNHVSSSSPYFDRYHQWPQVGACESVNSPYRGWFTFHDVAPGQGPCAGSQGPNSATYDSWYGFDSLAVLNKNNQQVRDLLYAGQDSVIKHWLRLGADGWRFDVMPDGSFPNDFWTGVRAAVKSIKPDGVMICECWPKGDVLSKATHGDQADTTMDYRFRNAILGFFGTTDNKNFNDPNASNQPPTLFAEKLMSLRQDYPDATYYTTMKLMDSHDTQRILWSLTPGANNRESKEFNAANVATGKQMLRLARVVQMTTPGAPTIYYGDEVGLTGDDDPDDRRPFPWTTSTLYFGAGGDHSLFDNYQSLISLRKSRAVLSSGNLHFLLTDNTNRTLAYVMRSTNDAALVAMNRNSTTETLTIPLNGWLPSAVQLQGAYGPLSNVSASNGTLTITLPGYSASVLLPTGVQNLTPPAAAGGLQAVAGNAQVALNWNPVVGAAGYNVYRSPVTGGGYLLVGKSSTTSFTDTTVTNGQHYYYIVRTVDTVGNEGGSSNEASALPAFPIGYAVLQWPKTITRTIGVNYDTIYGQVWVGGYTDNGGDPSGILAQVGFGPQGSTPAGWSTWTNMDFNTTSGNNYEYKAAIRALQPGTYDLLVRFSTDGGVTWTYGDQNGSGTATPGVYTVNPSNNTTPPSAPQNLVAADWSTTFIKLSWDPVNNAAEYWVYRHGASGAYGDPIAVVTSGTTFTDRTVNQGTTYSYVVKAVDSSLNVSAPSNEISQAAQAKLVAVTFNVTVPANTPSGDTVHLAGAFPSPYPAWDPAGLSMNKVDATHWTLTLQILDGTSVPHKYTRGSWNEVEKGASCEEIANHDLTVSYGTNGTQTVNETVLKWADLC